MCLILIVIMVRIILAPIRAAVPPAKQELRGIKLYDWNDPRRVSKTQGIQKADDAVVFNKEKSIDKVVIIFEWVGGDVCFNDDLSVLNMHAGIGHGTLKGSNHCHFWKSQIATKTKNTREAQPYLHSC
jgi:hypothetical protein